LPLRRLRRREREILGRIDRVSTKRPAQGSEPGASCLRGRALVGEQERLERRASRFAMRQRP
jgi:hypothetical protein